jgi:hypothetical protein
MKDKEFIKMFRKLLPELRRLIPEDCKDYPLCRCVETNQYYDGKIAQRLDEGMPEAAMIADHQAMFECLVKHCPETSVREWAKRQLAHRLFSKPINYADAMEAALRRKQAQSVN